MSWFISALIFPIPLFHLWLHVLLPWWRAHPRRLYEWAALAWLGAFLIFPLVDRLSSVLLTPTDFTRLVGRILILGGFFAAIGSFLALGPRRFFVWAVLRPVSAPRARLGYGLFRIVPHPAYTGYVAVALGNFLVGGKIYLLSVLIYLLVFTPIVIRFEEEEMKKRLE